jgi:hypothetical protein
MWYRFAGAPIPLINPIEGGFWVDDVPIGYGGTKSVREWSSLLQTTRSNINNQEKLNEFLNEPNRFKIEDGKKIYLRNTHNLSLDLIIPFTFYVNGEEILKGRVFPITHLRKLLQTAENKINKQEKLNEFLSDPRRFEIKDGAYFYKPIKISNKESQFISKFINYNKDSIYIDSQFKIRIFYKSEQNFNINKILRLDFAFMKNDKIVLAIEINGAQHYGFVSYNKDYTFNQWQDGLNNDILKINYCHDNNIPLLIFHHMLSDEEFKSILNNLYENPHIYDQYIPQLVIDNNVADVSLEFIKRQIYSHIYPVFKGVISFDDDISKKRYIKDTLILIAKLLGIYSGGIDKTDYIRSFNANVDLTENYNICLDIYNNLHPDYPLDRDDKITYSDLSKKPTIQKPKETNLVPTEEFKDKDNVV